MRIPLVRWGLLLVGPARITTGWTPRGFRKEPQIQAPCVLPQRRARLGPERSQAVRPRRLQTGQEPVVRSEELGRLLRR